ncbi:DUF402 domain-containing protein [Paenibacillus cremeus]|uniref:DUF402 domain-containing protein n=1 Tax=Paenibacillus cremeus TaxID=2163881 RepID=A0A559JDE2_9BACL|nr:DUF402 domain-containing protein [Paenibacillus cremeus]TVX97883.1 DUF402 domain-containing protein [Paenibacillus cremeus]
MNQNRMTIQALKYGNRLHYEWNTTLLEETDTHVFVLGEKGRALHHHTKQKVFTVPNWTIEFFSFHSWFTVSADVMDGTIQQYYCNINEPARREGSVISFVDLDLDYVYRQGAWKVVDEDEFVLHTVQFGYPPELVERARQELVRLQQRIASKQFPFDGALERFINRIPAT